MALVMCAAHAAAADDMASDAPALHFDLPAQPLARSLAVFGHLTGHSVLVTSRLTDGREASPVHGDFAPRDALQRMLVGTGLVARYTGASAFTLVPAPSATAVPDERAPVGAPTAGNAPALQAYAAVLQGAVTRVLCIAQPDAFGRYRLAVQLWIDPAGAVTEARLLEGSSVTGCGSAGGGGVARPSVRRLASTVASRAGTPLPSSRRASVTAPAGSIHNWTASR